MLPLNGSFISLHLPVSLGLKSMIKNLKGKLLKLIPQVFWSLFHIRRYNGRRARRGKTPGRHGTVGVQTTHSTMGKIWFIPKTTYEKLHLRFPEKKKNYDLLFFDAKNIFVDNYNAWLIMHTQLYALPTLLYSVNCPNDLPIGNPFSNECFLECVG